MFNPTASLLLRAGLVDEQQARAAEDHRLTVGGTLGGALVELGALDEERIVDFFHRTLMVPRLDAEALSRPSKRALAQLPADMAAEFRVFPVDVDEEGILTLAMADPSDAATVDEVSFFTQAFCQRAVAPESAICAAIERFYGVKVRAPEPVQPVDEAQLPPVPEVAAPRPQLEIVPGPVEEVPPPAPEPEEPVLLLTQVKRPRLDRLDVDDVAQAARALLDGAPDAAPPSSEEPVLLTKPVGRKKRTTLTGIPVLTFPDPPLVALRASASTDAVGQTVLDYIAQMTPRALLFVARQGRLAGHDARGDGFSRELARELVIALEPSSVFFDVLRSRLPFRGPLPETPANRDLLGVIGERSGYVLVLPVAVRERIVSVVYADGIQSPLPDGALLAVAREAGLAYERLLRDARHR